MEHTGSARTEREAATPLIVDAGGVRVGQIAYTYGFNGYPLPDGKPWTANELDAETAIADARAARAAGAEVVIASVHWGEQYRHEPTDRQRQVAEQLLSDEAIDLVIGHHAHVVQPMEKIGEQWVAYGLGNHVARHAEPRGVSEEGIAVRFRFTKDAGGWSVRQAEYIPTLIELGPPIRLVDLTSVPDDPRRHTARERIEEIVLSENAGADGLTRGGN